MCTMQNNDEEEDYMLGTSEADQVPDGAFDEAEAAVSAKPTDTSLPALIGSAKQIKWAATIREDALKTHSANLIARLRTVVNAGWWITNRYAAAEGTLTMSNIDDVLGPVQERRSYTPNLPSTCAPASVLAKIQNRQSTPARKIEASSSSNTGTIIEFAASVAQSPELARITIIALFSELKTGSEKAELVAEVNRRLDFLEQDVAAVRKLVA